jgi:hypothetical protein
MDENAAGFWIGLTMGIVGSLIAAVLSDYRVGNAVWRDGISRGYAEYCPLDDQYAWKGECK